MFYDMALLVEEQVNKLSNRTNLLGCQYLAIAVIILLKLLCDSLL